MSQFLPSQMDNYETVALERVDLVAQLDEQLCNACKLCLPTCHFNALLWIRADNELLLDHWSCNGCGTCIPACPTEALTLQPRNMG